MALRCRNIYVVFLHWSTDLPLRKLKVAGDWKGPWLIFAPWPSSRLIRPWYYPKNTTSATQTLLCLYSYRIYVHYSHDISNSFMCKHINSLSMPQGKDRWFCAKHCLAFCGLLPSVTSAQCEETKTNWVPCSKSNFTASVTKPVIRDSSMHNDATTIPDSSVMCCLTKIQRS